MVKIVLKKAKWGTIKKLAKSCNDETGFHLKKGSTYQLIHNDMNEVVGFVDVEIPFHLLHVIYIKPEYRGQGYATETIRQLVFTKGVSAIQQVNEKTLGILEKLDLVKEFESIYIFNIEHLVGYHRDLHVILKGIPPKMMVSSPFLWKHNTDVHTIFPVKGGLILFGNDDGAFKRQDKAIGEFRQFLKDNPALSLIFALFPSEFEIREGVNLSRIFIPEEIVFSDPDRELLRNELVTLLEAEGII